MGNPMFMGCSSHAVPDTIALAGSVCARGRLSAVGLRRSPRLNSSIRVWQR